MTVLSPDAPSNAQRHHHSRGLPLCDDRAGTGVPQMLYEALHGELPEEANTGRAEADWGAHELRDKVLFTGVQQASRPVPR